MENDWKFELDAYGDPSWGKKTNFSYQEIRIYPTKNNWGVFLLTARSEYSSNFEKKKLKEGNKEDMIKFAEDYVKKH